MENTNDSKNLFQLISSHRSAIIGIASLLILFFHTWQRFLINVPILGDLEEFLKVTTYFGVDIFFFLSGMGLYISRSKNNICVYYFKRLKRLCIPVLITGILKIIVDDCSITYTIKALTGYWFYTKSIYEYLWFIPAIATIYALYPVYDYLLNKSKNKIIFTIDSIGIWFILVVHFRFTTRWDLYAFYNRIPIFLVGVLLGASKDNCKIKINTCTIFITSIMLLVGIYLLYESNYNGMLYILPVSNACIPTFLVAISFSILIAWILDFKIFKRIDSFFKSYGVISLELYVIQEWLLGHLYHLIYDYVKYPWIFNICFLLIATVAAIIVFYINKGFIRLIEKCWKLLHQSKTKINPNKTI